MNDQDYQYLKRKLLKLTGIDLDSYKSQQMRRRLNMFYAHTGVKNIVEYCQMIEHDRDMLEKLRNFLTINVSEFFRDSASFTQLRSTILPLLLKQSPRLNIWSAGCSHGAEPYSVALVLEGISPGGQHRILATDIDEGALKRARAGGPYNPAEVKNVPSSMLQKYFVNSNGDHMFSEKIRRKVEFRQQNLLRDRFEEGFHLIICRNVTIYFTEKTKNEINRKFFNSLRSGGILFIGGTEAMLDVTSLGFIGLRPSFYQKPVPGIIKERPTRREVLLKA